MTKFYDHVMRENSEICRIVTGAASMLLITVANTYFRLATDVNLKPVTCTSKLSRKRNYTSTEQQYIQNFFSPYCFRNLKSYDSHFVIKHFERKYVESRNSSNEVSFDDTEITPLNCEKYLSFQIGNLRFLDSYQFLSTSLEQLVSLLLKAGRENFVHTSKHLGADDEVFAKGFYPYSYMTSPKRFEETSLPTIEKFHDTLKDEPLSQADYNRALQTWSRFSMNSSPPKPNLQPPRGGGW